jgi:hypothetical protein
MKLYHAVAVVLCLLIAPSADRPTLAADASDEITLAGGYTSTLPPRDPDTLKAVLKSTGANKYDVTFTATFKGKPMIYTGTIEGDLKNGPITGQAKSADGKMSYTFNGASKDGAIACKHFKNGKDASGEFTLK